MKRVFKRRHIDYINEFMSYANLPAYSGDLNPLEWWKINETQYPNLAKMARDYLAIPATSVPSEQSFSISKNLITDNRNRLVGKTIRASMCLKSWWNVLDDNE